jgi:hypothetical protein
LAALCAAAVILPVACAHPAISIVMDAAGVVYYSDGALWILRNIAVQ